MHTPLKKGISLLLVFVLFGFAACDRQQLAEQTTTTEAAIQTSPTETTTTAVETTTAPDLVLLQWPLLFVNKTHKVPKGYDPPLTTLSNGQKVDERIYPELQQMFQDAKNAGFTMTPANCYRTRAQQRAILREYIQDYIKQGHSEKEAKKLALQYVARPGHSEHELGLAVDINAEKGTDGEKLFAWLQANSYLYGFIERYPADKSDITGISYERWHYRYVGKKAAKIMFREKLTLEEYLQEFPFGE